MTALDAIRNLGLVAIPFTLYFAWTKIGYRVVVQPTWGARRHSAPGITRLTIINMKDRSLAIFGAHAVLDRVVIPLKDFDPPLILKAYEAVNVEMTEVSDYYLGTKPYEWNIAGKYLNEVDIFLSTASKMVKCKHGAPPSRVGFARRRNIALASTQSDTFNGRVYNSNVKYAIGYLLDGAQQTAFIDKRGFIDWMLFPNMLRVEDMVSEATVRNVLDANGMAKIIGDYYVHALGPDS